MKKTTSTSQRNAGARSSRARGSGCLWKWEEWHGYYETACGNAYCFDDEFKPGKGYQYCPGCGQPILTELDEERRKKLTYIVGRDWSEFSPNIASQPTTPE